MMARISIVCRAVRALFGHEPQPPMTTKWCSAFAKLIAEDIRLRTEQARQRVADAKRQGLSTPLEPTGKNGPNSRQFE